jgi:hypothetical protein
VRSSFGGQGQREGLTKELKALTVKPVYEEDWRITEFDGTEICLKADSADM